MDKKHRKFFVVRGPKQSEGCNLMPKMYQNTFGMQRSITLTTFNY